MRALSLSCEGREPAVCAHCNGSSSSSNKNSKESGPAPLPQSPSLIPASSHNADSKADPVLQVDTDASRSPSSIAIMRQLVSSSLVRGVSHQLIIRALRQSFK